MSDAAVVGVAIADRPMSAAERMSREAAIVGAHLGELIARTPSGHEPAIAQGLTFLSAMFDATQETVDVGRGNHPIDRLGAALSLTRAELDLVVLAGLTEEHEGYATVLRALHPRGEPLATVGLAAQLACSTLRDRMALRETLTLGTAVRTGVLSIDGSAPFFERDLELAPGLWLVLCGLDSYPAALKPIAARAACAGLDAWLDGPDAARAVRAIDAGERRPILVIADSEESALNRALVLADAASRRCAAFEIPAGTAASTGQLGAIHALARGAVPVFVMLPGDGPTPMALPSFDPLPGPILVCMRRSTSTTASSGAALTVDVPRLTTAERETLWRATLPELEGSARELASRYTIEPDVALAVAADVRDRAARGAAPIALDTVADAVRTRCHPPAAAGLKLVRPTAGWDRLVLRPDRMALLREALDRLLHQSVVLDRWRFLDGRPGARGVRLLFSGPPGTGKTLSAEVLAHSLGVDLMIVDISRVVSKWIGETEKHLAEAFDAAEHTQAVLLFDEADALFGKRTEVSDAHDRYANLETAYLLSRLERFEGLAVLSTNLKQNIDPAFLRRLEFVIDFEEPTAHEREALWRCHLPPAAPVAPDVDLKELAALYPIVGGLIRNASVAAGFLAAAGGAPIGRDHLVGAVRREYDKSAKAFPGAPSGARPA